MRRPLNMPIVILILIENETWIGGEKDPELVADGNVPPPKISKPQGLLSMLHSSFLIPH